MRLKKRIPEPEFTTGQVTPNYTAYAWRIDCNGLSILGDTRDEAVQNYRDAMLSEYGVAV